MTTRNRNVESHDNQATPPNNGGTTIVLVADTDRAKKYHKPRAGTFTACGRTNCDYERASLGEVLEEYEKCAKCFQGDV